MPPPRRRSFAGGWLARLNDEQRAVVEHGFDAAADPIAVARGDVAPLFVVAGAGSGKTTTLAARVARLVVAGARPERILVLAFSRRAAAELERRVGAALHEALGLAPATRPPSLAWCGTFHSVGARLLRDVATAIGLDPSFTVDDRGDAEDLMHLLRLRLGLAESRSRFPQKATCLAIYSRTVNAQEPLGDVLSTRFPWCAAHADALSRLYAAYVEAKLAQRVLDFDDLLLCWAEAMAVPSVGATIAARFDHVLVDEYQDTNRLQASIVRHLKPDGRGLAVVGDDAQSIYSFRAADVRNMLDFPAAFAPSRVVVRTLVRNHRSTPPILDAANAVIALAAEGYAKRLTGIERAGSERPRIVRVAGELEQACHVADAVLARREEGLRLADQAVLFRTASHSHALEVELARRDIPFVKFGGLAFLEASHVKDVLAVLRFGQNPRGERAALRAVQLVQGMGPAHTDRLVRSVAAADVPGEAIRRFDAPAAARSSWPAFASLVERLQSAGEWPGDLDAVAAWYAPVLERLHPDDAGPRASDLAQLALLARGTPSRARFLAELALDPPAATSDLAGPPHRDEDQLVLSTIHSSKGREWSAVTVLNVVDGCLPSDMAAGSAAEIEEERRLLYVAMTRARHHLALVVPQRFHMTAQPARGDRHVWAGISRFLPPDVQQRCFDDVLPLADDEAPVGCALESSGRRSLSDLSTRAAASRRTRQSLRSRRPT